MKTLVLLSFLGAFSGVSFGSDVAIQTQIFDLKNGEYILPIQKDDVVSVVKEFSENPRSESINQELTQKGYTVDIKTTGDCTQSACQGSLIGRRFFQVRTGDIKAVVDVYTSDLRNPKDKAFKVSGISVERHHWDVSPTGATKIEGKPLPMTIGKEYILKKCRNGFMVDWKCNNIAYELIDSGENIFVLLGRQVTTEKDPTSYSDEPCSNGASNCQVKFLDLQKRNSSNGILSLTVFKSKTPNLITISEINLSGVADSGEVTKLMKGRHLIESGMEQEYNVLERKLAALGESEKSLTDNSGKVDQSSFKSMRYLLLVLAMAFAAMTIFFARKEPLS